MGFAVLAWLRDDCIAGIEQNSAAVFHIGIDALECCIGGAGGARYDRPIDQRIEHKLVARDVEPNRIARFKRCALREKEREPREPGLADGIDFGISSDHISKLSFKRRLRNIRSWRLRTWHL